MERKPPVKKTTPTERTLKVVEDMDGWLVGNVERWKPSQRLVKAHRSKCGCWVEEAWTLAPYGKRIDLYGFVDMVAMTPEGTRLLQVTTSDNVAARIKKITGPCQWNLDDCLNTPGVIVEVWGWRELAKRVKRRVWWARRVQILFDQTDSENRYEIRELEDM